MQDTASVHAHAIWAPNESDELLRLAVQVGGIGIYETDLEQSRTRFSPELCAILGVPAGTEMAYAEASRVFDERDRASVNASVEAAVNSTDEGKWSGVHRILRPDGSIRWVSIQGRRHYRNAADGRHAVRSVGTVVDITHLKETEAALRESELRLRLALEAAQMGTFESDIGGSQAIIDAQEAHLLGLPPETRLVSSEELRARIPLKDLHSDPRRTRNSTMKTPPRFRSASFEIHRSRIVGMRQGHGQTEYGVEDRAEKGLAPQQPFTSYWVSSAMRQIGLLSKG
jgi:PAS domain S-box-containing protein